VVEETAIFLEDFMPIKPFWSLHTPNICRVEARHFGKSRSQLEFTQTWETTSESARRASGDIKSLRRTHPRSPVLTHFHPPQLARPIDPLSGSISGPLASGAEMGSHDAIVPGCTAHEAR
jgi:hypothetical protein